MGKVKDEQLFTLLRDFLLVYLPNQRKASSNTVKAYRTALNQFLKYTAGQKNLSVLSVTSGMVKYEMVKSYLDWLSAEKNAAPATRNNRLAAIRAFISYAAACRPEYISIASGLAAIGIQKNDRFAKVDYMTEEAVKTLLAEPDTRTEIGVRDQFLMIFLFAMGIQKGFTNLKLMRKPVRVKRSISDRLKTFGYLFLRRRRNIRNLSFIMNC